MESSLGRHRTLAYNVDVHSMERLENDRRFVVANLSEPRGYRGDDHEKQQRRRKNAFPEQQPFGAGHSASRSQQRPLQRALSGRRSASYFRAAN